MSTKFEVGQRVRVAPDAKNSDGSQRGQKFESGFGRIDDGPDSDGDYWVRSEDDGGYSWYVLARFLSPVAPRPITFDEVRVGDRVRLTHDFGNGDSIVRTMTVDQINGNRLETVGEDMSITRNITTYNNATFELLSRPEPAKVYKAGDVITRDEIKNLPNHTVITTGEDDGETVRIFVDGMLYNEQAVRLGGFRTDEMDENWTFTVRYVSEAGA